ncbi:hypothetical protein FA95DRAFT_1580623 [Auriscalpium vulgare]|uniref:Uncharacterized protein n=1 Tax=Auriscalpium vulgare TaxID=40419 RepID=A0ACB8S4Y8_9AGAM|nr:hypothetical protein FA95DRAFT_1580623 [Auriscalpium vulgare]
MTTPTTVPDTIPDMLQPLRDSIIHKPPYVSGTLPLTDEQFHLYYKSGDAARLVDLAHATPEQLADLSEACHPATFGRGQEDVLDETYRKAGKLDTNLFATPLVPERTRLIDIVRDYLLEGQQSTRSIRVELYKLNIYSEGSFFKAHVDTPRGEDMFGSLVLVFPTPHTGGALALRHRGEEWMFDSAKAVAAAATPSIGFVAFFSNIEHEVSPVSQGHRVTLTFNLYFADAVQTLAPNLLVPRVAPANEEFFRSTFERLLKDPTFLPEGGTLGFGLTHAYPVKTQKTLDPLYPLLKGSDAVVHRACTELGLSPKLYLLRRSTGIIDKPLDPTIYDDEDVPTPVHMLEQEGGLVLSGFYYKGSRVDEQVQWVTEVTDITRHGGAYMAHGNQSTLEYAYGDVCMIVRVGKAGDRTRVPSIEEIRKAAEKRGRRAKHGF